MEAAHIKLKTFPGDVVTTCHERCTTCLQGLKSCNCGTVLVKQRPRRTSTPHLLQANTRDTAPWLTGGLLSNCRVLILALR